jgi:hypothetical protein
MIAVPPEVFLYEMEELAMKFVKKLLAVVLAGTMVLTLLTSCGTSKTKIEDYIKSMPSVTLESILTIGSDSHVTLKPVKNNDAALLASKAKEWLAASENADKTAKEYMDELDYDAYVSFREPFVDDYKAECVGISFIKLPSEKFDSQNAWIAYNLMSKERVMIISNWDAVDGSEGTVSVTTEKIGDNTYAFAVIRTPGRDPDAGEDGGSIHL